MCHRGRLQRRRPCLIYLDNGANNNGANNNGANNNGANNNGANNNGANNGGNFPRFPRRRKGT